MEVIHPVTLEGAAEVEALAYVLDRTHPQYSGGLDLEAQARIIAAAEGPAGPNADYLHNTVLHLEEIGLHDPELAELDRLVRALRKGR
jgi:cation transport protein ChaC